MRLRNSLGLGTAAVVPVALSLGSLLGPLAPPAAPVPAASRYASAAVATVHPGVTVFTNGAQCTSNFVFTDGANTYLGQAAHCSGTGGNTATNGCTSPSLPLGTKVAVTGASKSGTLVYNSWLTMQQNHEKNPDTCQYNDLALVLVSPADVGKVNPSIPVIGGPTGINTTGTQAGDVVLSYGNSELRLGLSLLSPKVGVSLGDSAGGYSHEVLTVTPGIPGDSGSAFVDSSGRALGILSTLSLLPLPGSNGVGDLGRELAYLNAHGGIGGHHVSLVNGDTPFHAPL